LVEEVCGGSPLFLSIFLQIGFFNCMKKGYYQITEALESAAAGNDQINQVTWGNIFDLDFRKMDMFPIAHMITGNATLGERTITYEFDLLVMDIVDYSKEAKDLYEGNMTKQDIYHRTLAVISEILASFRRGDQYDAYFRLTNDPVAEPFDEDMEANVCGWKATLLIEAINPNNIC
jgi:hypothetical protein